MGALLITNQPCYQPEDLLHAMQVFYRSKAAAAAKEMQA